MCVGEALVRCNGALLEIDVCGARGERGGALRAVQPAGAAARAAKPGRAVRTDRQRERTRGRARWLQRPSALLAEDPAPSARLVALKARAAPPHPRAPLEQRGSSPRVPALAVNRPKVEPSLRSNQASKK